MYYKSGKNVISLTFSHGVWKWKPKRDDAKQTPSPALHHKAGLNVIPQDHLSRNEQGVGTLSAYRGHFLNGLI
jgi:hypothetical protein